MADSPAQHLDVATPERVALSLPIAGIGFRTLAYLIDLLLLFVGWVVGYFVLSLLVSDVLGAFQGLSGLAQTLAVVGAFATQWVYWTACEVLGGGQTPGKRAVRIRVVREDGAPVGMFESAVRNLLRVVDFLPLLYATGVVAMLLSREHRRLGDRVAGTVLIRDERIDLGKYAVAAAPMVAVALPVRPAGTLGAEDAELVLSFLERAPGFVPEARARLTVALLDRCAGELSGEQRAALAADPSAAESYLRARATAQG